MRGIGDEGGSLRYSMTHGVPWIQGTVGHVNILYTGFHATEVLVGLVCIVVNLFISKLRAEDISAEGCVKGGGELGAEGLIPGARALVPTILIAGLVVPGTTCRNRNT